MPGLVNSYLQTIIIAIHVAGTAVDVVRRHYGVDHLHESGGSVDFSSNSVVCFTLGSDIILSLSAMSEFNIRCFRLVSCMMGFTP